MNDHCFVYVYWNDGRSREVWRDIRNPVVVSIATLRSHNPRVPVVVIDLSEIPQRWGHYPIKLGFEVRRVDPQKFPCEQSDTIVNLCSRIFSIDEYALRSNHNKIIACDSDVFWLKNPFELLEICGFHGNCHNNGVFAYDRDSSDAIQFIESWKCSTMRAMESSEFRKKIVDQYYVPYFNDEAVYCYVRKKESKLVREIGTHLNYIVQRENDLDDIKNFATNLHFCTKLWGSQRGVYALYLEEFYHPLTKVLSRKELLDIFGEDHFLHAGHFSLDFLMRARAMVAGKTKWF